MGLPHFPPHKTAPPMHPTVLKILAIFEGFRMAPLPSDQYATIGKAVLAEKMTPFVLSNQPIPFVMLGFPMKSSNDRDKVLGKLPDLGEEIAFKNFRTFNNEVSIVYPPGISMNVVNDGYAFNDLLGILDHTVNEYEEVTLNMSKDMPVTIYDLTHFYTSGRMNEKREKLMTHWGIGEAKLEERILFDPDTNMLYKGMMRFMEEELMNRPYDSNNQRHKAAKKLAREMMLRNEAYSGLVANEFSSMIRLSMHPSVNAGKKYSFQLIPGESTKVRHSPWHSAILVTDDGYETIHKADALAKGHRIVTRDRQPYYFAQ